MAAAYLTMTDGKKYLKPDFGAWVKSKIAQGNLNIQDFVVETRLTYSAVSRILNSGNGGKPQQPGAKTVEEYGQALIRMGLISSIDDAYIAAGFKVAGYVTVPETELRRLTPPEGLAAPQVWIDNPDEFQHLLRQFEGVSPQAQRKYLTLIVTMLEQMRKVCPPD